MYFWTFQEAFDKEGKAVINLIAIAVLMYATNHVDKTVMN